ncbi:PilN domain-containing protein [Shewanella gelidii]|uniref:MSHA biogenesis protein MshI2 n=1 Tax=Shewanella gelidii TaxID=1642821 RepID=A0A917JVG8_9GAMM|nr:PilN domain-containing protein [Shewanella gelidii]MCL1098746.1 PilN domain-containing protein [Shewanella gelidii]GGI87912.1 MSHA biogenesis protein MshI2 [Shewanella gelidii]
MSANKTRINLYSDALLPVKLRLSFQRLMVWSLVFLMIVCGLNGLGYWQLENQKSALAAANVEKQIHDNEIAQLNAQIAAHTADKKLVKRVEVDQQQLDLKRLLLNELSQRENMTSQGYSLMMRELAQVADANVWLERIQVDESQYIFQGYSKYPDSVPRWIDKLAETQSLKGHAFATMSMKKSDSHPLSFTLTSTLEAADKVKVQ